MISAFDQATSPGVLFVDDEPNLLEAIQRILSLHDVDWRIDFAQSGSEALAKMERDPAWVVVSDMAMPGMDGQELIALLAERFPHTVPIILSGHWSELMAFAQFGPRLRYLSKPVSGDLLVWTVRQAIAEIHLSYKPKEPRELNVAIGHPVIDSQHREINAFSRRLRTLFDQGLSAGSLVEAMSEYYKLLSNHYSLEEALMERLPREKYASHIAVHSKHHKENIDFVNDCINDISNEQDLNEIISVIKLVFENMTENMNMDDIDLFEIIKNEKLLT